MAQEMKESGIEWIGKIPRDWEFRRGKRVFTQRHEKGNIIQLQLLSPTQKYGVIPQGKYEELSGMKAVKLNAGIDLSLMKTIHKGDFCISLRSFQGGFEYSNYEGVVSPAYQVFHPINEIVDEYYKFLFKATTFIERVNSYTLTLRDGKKIAFSDFGDTMIPYPPLSIQHRIADYLDTKCSEIDAMVEKTKATIEEYKKLKYALVADAVTKGMDSNTEMAESGVDWIGQTPTHWAVIKIKYLFSVNKRIANTLGYDILSVTQQGLKIKDISNNEGQVSSDYSKYQIVKPYDFVMNHMDLLTGWVDCATVEGVTSPDYRVFTLDKIDSCHREYYKYLFQLCYKHKIFYGLGQGVSNLGRWRLQTDKFINFEVPVPPIGEQKEIANYLDQKCQEIDNLIEKKQTIVTELEQYKKSLIYECVTGKREIGDSADTTQVIVFSPYFPAKIVSDKHRFAQSILAAKILDTTANNTGRVKLEKMLYVIEHHIGFDFDTEYTRKVAGPFSTSIYECEGVIGRKNRWFNIKKQSKYISYKATKNSNKYKRYYSKYFASYDHEIRRIISIFAPLTTDQAEMYATLYAVWNDMILEQKSFTDDDIVADVLGWNESKKRFSNEKWHEALASMRNLDLIPKGYCKHTVREKV